MRRTRPAAALVAAGVLLAGCTTSVTGTGRPAASRPGGGNATGSGSPGATDALSLWQRVHDEVTGLPAVAVTGSFAGAGFGPAAAGASTITGTYGVKGGKPLADVTVTAGSETVQVRATGGTAWVRATPAFLVAYGKTPAEAAAAGGHWAVLADDQAGLDILASLDGFLLICAPDDDTDDLTATSPNGSRQAVRLASATEGGSLVVTLTPPRVLSSKFSGDDLQFSYPAAAPAVEAPAAADVVTLPDF